MDLSSYDLEYLRPPFEASFINHNLDYIKSGSGTNAKRRIFYNVSFETYELEAIQALEELLKEQSLPLPPEWNQSETLKFLYAKNFDLEAAAQMIQTCLEWRSDPATSLVDEAVLEYLEAGVIYLWGLDEDCRPILIVNLNKLKLVQIDEDTFKIALIIMFDIIRTYCFLPRKIENWVVMVDAQTVKIIDPENIQSIMYLVRCCFPCTLDKLILITSPNFKESHWNLIQSVVGKNDLQDVHVISTVELNKLQAFIPSDALEKKYGGECPNVEKFWPPPQRMETYHRTSITSLKQYNTEPDTMYNAQKENVSVKRGTLQNSSVEAGYPQTGTFALHTEPRSNQSIPSENNNRFQPNQLGVMANSEVYIRKTQGTQGRPFEEKPTKSGAFSKSDDMVSRKTAPVQVGQNYGSPKKKYDPFQLARYPDGESDHSLSTQNNRNAETERILLTEREVPKSKGRNDWDARGEPSSLQKQAFNHATQAKRREDENIIDRRDRRTIDTKPLGEVDNRRNYAEYAGNKGGMGFQREHISEFEGLGSRHQTGDFKTFEEIEENTPSRMSYSKQDKEQLKKRLIEISAKKDEEEEEEEAKSKTGLFCGCCVGSAKKSKTMRPKSRMKKSKYENY